MQGYKIEHGLCIKACGGSGLVLRYKRELVNHEEHKASQRPLISRFSFVHLSGLSGYDFADLSHNFCAAS
jgi:hypothetical protein